MSIHLRENPYSGINAHLHSQFQRKGSRSPSTWSAFRKAYLASVANDLNASLPSNYRALIWHSLSVQEDLRWDVIEVPAIVIYESVESGEHEDLGNPVARIELLSPANKLGGSFYDTYRYRRREALQSGLPLVEIDYLHETNSPVHGLPTYPHDPNSFPYTIIISDPRLPPSELGVRAYGFHVDDPIPTLTIPLSGEDEVAVEFSVAYHFTFAVGKWGTQIDYTDPPERFDTYSELDRQRIHQRLTSIQQHHSQKE